MSYKFNDTENYRGLVQMYEKECGMTRGTVSGDTNLLKEFAADANESLDDYFAVALTASGKWQLDDSNHDDYPILYGAITTGQQDYTFTEDENGNLVLDVIKVRILSSPTATHYDDLQALDDPTDSQYEFDAGLTGVPSGYDKLANGIRFNVTPDYSVARGIELQVSREASYFSYDDIEKKPGVPGLHHKFFYLKPAMKWAERNDAARYQAIAAKVLKMEGNEETGLIGSIARYFGKRAKDERPRITPKITPYL